MQRHLTAALAFLCCAPSLIHAQDRIKTWPVYQRAQKDASDFQGLIKSSSVQTRWIDATHLAYRKGEDWMVVELPSGKETKADKEPQAASGQTRRNPNAGRRNPGRGGQFSEAFSEDGKTKAVYKDANVFVSKDGGDLKAVTTDGDLAKRVKYGTGSWVYGEELGQTEAMGLNNDGRYLWYYRFDENKVIDNYVVFRQNTPHPVFEPQAYPKPGDDNPTVDLFVCDTTTMKSVPVKVRPGIFDLGIGHYVYDIRWSPLSNELLFRRTDRRQKVMEYCAANPATGDVRVIVHEEWPQSYVENSLAVWFLDTMDGIEKRPDLKGKMLWESQRGNGYINLYLVDFATGKTTPVTQNAFDSTRVVRVDLAAGRVYYMAHSEQNAYLDQLFSVGFDGKANARATDPKFDHSVTLSPDGKWAVDTYQTSQDPPAVRLIDMKGRVVKELAKTDLSAFLAAGYSLPERVTYTSPDGKTQICGVLHKPRNFDPTKKYPLIIDVYGGPGSAYGGGFNENFRAYDGDTGYGVLKASFDNRGTGGRGKAFSDPLYTKMGIAEIDDQAEGAKAVIAKGFVDTDKVGITGTSYGGYASVMCLLRHPEVYKAAVACSSVTWWQNYDTIYTERYMGLLDENKEAYAAGSAMTYADKLSGWLLLYYGTSDENVHPANSLQLIQKLQRAGKSFEVQVGTDQGHTGLNDGRTYEFFFDRLGISHN